MLSVIKKVCVEAVRLLRRAIRENKQNRHQSRTVGEETIYVKY